MGRSASLEREIQLCNVYMINVVDIVISRLIQLSNICVKRHGWVVSFGIRLV